MIERKAVAEHQRILWTVLLWWNVCAAVQMIILDWAVPDNYETRGVETIEWYSAAEDGPNVIDNNLSVVKRLKIRTAPTAHHNLQG